MPILHTDFQIDRLRAANGSRGQIVVIFALAIIVFVGLCAIVIDVVVVLGRTSCDAARRGCRGARRRRLPARQLPPGLRRGAAPRRARTATPTASAASSSPRSRTRPTTARLRRHGQRPGRHVLRARLRHHTRSRPRRAPRPSSSCRCRWAARRTTTASALSRHDHDHDTCRPHRGRRTGNPARRRPVGRPATSRGHAVDAVSSNTIVRDHRDATTTTQQIGSVRPAGRQRSGQSTDADIDRLEVRLNDTRSAAAARRTNCQVQRRARPGTAARTGSTAVTRRRDLTDDDPTSSTRRHRGEHGVLGRATAGRAATSATPTSACG